MIKIWNILSGKGIFECEIDHESVLHVYYDNFLNQLISAGKSFISFYAINEENHLKMIKNFQAHEDVINMVTSF